MRLILVSFLLLDVCWCGQVWAQNQVNSQASAPLRQSTPAPFGDRQRRILPIPRVAPVTIGATGPNKVELPGPPDTSMWFRHYQAGEDAINKGDEDLAKEHWNAALAELEKKKALDPNDMFIMIKLSALEQHMTELYPTDYSKYKDKPDEELKIRKEQVDSLYRIARLNERFLPNSELLKSKSEERYETSRRDYEKALKTKGPASAAKNAAGAKKDPTTAP